MLKTFSLKILTYNYNLNVIVSVFFFFFFFFKKFSINCYKRLSDALTISAGFIIFTFRSFLYNFARECQVILKSTVSEGQSKEMHAIYINQRTESR